MIAIVSRPMFLVKIQLLLMFVSRSSRRPSQKAALVVSGPAEVLLGVHGRPRFAKRSMRDDMKVKIAPVHSDFVCDDLSLSLMECAGWCPIALSHLTCQPNSGLCQPRGLDRLALLIAGFGRTPERLALRLRALQARLGTFNHRSRSISATAASMVIISLPAALIGSSL
jgi:hypothetical protein